MNNKYGIIWLDGNFIDSENANISVMTHGLHYASSVFEGIRVYNNKIFMLEEHITRLFNSAKILDMNIQHSFEEIIHATRKIVEINNINFGYIRPLVFRGSEEIKIAAPNNSIVTAISTWETAPINQPKNLNNGYKLTLGNYRRSPKECMPFESKCAANYAISTVEKHKALANKFDDALLLDIEDNVAETTSSNIFFVKNNAIYTPVADCFLNGLTRQKVLSIAEILGIQTHIQKIPYNTIGEFDDCFITSTTLDIVRVTKIDDIFYEKSVLTENIYKYFYENFITK